MPIRHTYAEHGDACAAAHALDLVGDRWAIVLIRELVLGPKRFSDLLASARGATPAVISVRLSQLVEAGIARRTALPAPARIPVYDLTGWGRSFEPVLVALGRWAQASPALPADGGLTPDGVVLAMRTMLDGPGPQPGVDLDLLLHDERVSPVSSCYRLQWDDDGLRVEKWPRRGGHPFVEYDSSAWAELILGAGDLDELVPASTRDPGARAARRCVRHARRLLGRTRAGTSVLTTA